MADRKFNLKQCIALSNLNTEEFADKIGVTRSTVQKWISNPDDFRKTSIENVKRICDLAGIELTEIEI